MSEPPRPKKAHVRAVPWKTPPEDMVKGALGEVPAYVRRARRVEDAMRDLFRDAALAREERLLFVVLRLGHHRDVLAALDREPSVGVTSLHDAVAGLEAWRRRRSRSVGLAGEPARSLASLRESVARFNRRWEAWVREEAPLARVNREVDGYNRHYRLERQCALKYVPFDAIRFEEKSAVTAADLLREFPLLTVP